MSKKCNTCGMEYDDSLDKCPACSKAAEEAGSAAQAAADNVTKITPDAAKPAQNDVKEAAAEAAESIKKAVKAAASSVADKASAAASDVMNSEAVKEVKSGKLSHKTIGIAAVAAVVIILLIVIGVAGGNNYKAPIDHAVKGIENGNYKEYLKCMPKFMSSELLEYDDDGYFKDYFSDIKDELADEYGKNFDITYTIKDKTKIKKAKLRDIREDIEDEFDKKVKVSEGYTLQIKLKIKGRDGADRTETSVNVYKINGKWYILDDSGFLF